MIAMVIRVVLYLFSAVTIGYALYLFFSSRNPDISFPYIGYPVQSKFMIFPAIFAATLCVFGYKSFVLSISAGLSVGMMIVYLKLLTTQIDADLSAFILQDYNELLFLGFNVLILTLMICCYFSKHPPVLLVLSSLIILISIWMVIWRQFQGNGMTFTELFYAEALTGRSVPFAALLCIVCCIVGAFRDIQKTSIVQMFKGS